MCKKTGQITTHLPADIELAVKNIAYAEDLKPSEWVYKLIVTDLKNRLQQAKNTLEAVGHLQNDEIEKSLASE